MDQEARKLIRSLPKATTASKGELLVSHVSRRAFEVYDDACHARSVNGLQKQDVGVGIEVVEISAFRLATLEQAVTIAKASPYRDEEWLAEAEKKLGILTFNVKIPVTTPVFVPIGTVRPGGPPTAYNTATGKWEIRDCQRKWFYHTTPPAWDDIREGDWFEEHNTIAKVIRKTDHKLVVLRTGAVTSVQQETWNRAAYDTYSTDWFVLGVTFHKRMSDENKDPPARIIGIDPALPPTWDDIRVNDVFNLDTFTAKVLSKSNGGVVWLGGNGLGRVGRREWSKHEYTYWRDRGMQHFTGEQARAFLAQGGHAALHDAVPHYDTPPPVVALMKDKPNPYTQIQDRERAQIEMIKRGWGR